MNIEQFDVLRTIAQAKSFTKAAKILNFTQPAISSQIKQLEQKYNVALFIRGNTGVKLTEAGKKFYEYGDKILALYAEMEREIGNISGSNKEFINVGASYTAGNYFLPSTIITFKEMHSNVYIRLDIGHSQDIISDIKDRVIDIGVVDGDFSNDKDINAKNLTTNEVVVIVPPRGKWLDIDSITLQELMEEPFISREEDSGIRQFFDSHLKGTRGMSFSEFNIVTEMSNFGAIKEAVMRNKGVSMVPLPVVQRELAEGHLLRVDIKNFKLCWDMQVVTRAHESLTGLKEKFFNSLLDPDVLWKAESEYVTNQKMRFI